MNTRHEHLCVFVGGAGRQKGGGGGCTSSSATPGTTCRLRPCSSASSLSVLLTRMAPTCARAWIVITAPDPPPARPRQPAGGDRRHPGKCIVGYVNMRLHGPA